MRYHAFISYSHQADRALAAALQSALQSFAKPWLKVRAMNVFLDQTDLQANPHLWSTIEQALEQSQAFIYLASPRAAVSRWVPREIEWWVDRHANDDGHLENMYLALTSGTIEWDSTRGDFDWEATDAVPRSLSNRFSEEPLWVDLKEAKDREAIDLKHSESRVAVLNLAAPLRGVPKRDLDSEDARRQRRRVQGLVGGLGVVSALAVSAWFLKVEADHQRDRATEQAKVATAGRLASDAGMRAGDNPDLAHLLAVGALNHADTFEARSSLLQVLQASPRLQSFFHGHDSLVNSLTIRPDGAVLASADEAGFLRFWNVAEASSAGPPVRLSSTAGVAYSPDGNVLAVPERDGYVRLLDTGSNTFVGPGWKVHADSIQSLAFAPDGATLASGGSDGKIHISDIDSRSVQHVLPDKHSGPVLDLDFSSDGATLASAGRDRTVVLWDLATKTRLGPPLRAHSRPVYSVRFSPDDRVLASTSYDGKVGLWRLQDIKNPSRIEEPKDAHICCGTSLAFSDDGQILASGAYDGTIRLWSPRSGQPWNKPDSDAVLRAGPVHSLVFAPDSKVLFSGEGGGRIRRWDLTRHHGAGLSKVVTRGGPFKSVALNHDGSLLAGVDQTDAPQLWSVPVSSDQANPVVLTAPDRVATRGDRRRSTRSLKDPRTLTFSPDGRLLALGTDKRLVVWDTATRQALGLPSEAQTPAGLATFSPDGARLATAGLSVSNVGFYASRIRSWNVSAGTLSTSTDQVAEVADGGVMGMAFSPNGTVLATGGFRQIAMKSFVGRITLRQALTMQELWDNSDTHVDWVTDVAFNGNGSLMLCASLDHSASLWFVHEGGQLELAAKLKHDDPVLAVAFSSLADVAVTGDESGNVRLWDIRNPSRPEQIAGALTSGEHAVNDLVSGGNLGWLAAASERDIRLWDIDPKSWAAKARERANRVMTEAEWGRYIGVDLLDP